MPVPAPHPFLAHPGVLAFAHRGGGEPTENSMAAFERAVGLGYRYLETDVRASRDGQLVVFHDATLDRLSEHTGPIEAQPWSRLAGVGLRGGGRIALLEDLLGTWPHVRVNVDVKSPAAVAPLVSVLRRTRSLDRVCVASFSERRLVAVRRRVGSQLCTSLGPVGVTALVASAAARVPPRLTPLGPRAPLPAACAQVPESAGPVRVVTRRFVHTAHRLGLQVHVWVVDAADEMHRLLDLGVDGLVSTQLETLRGVLTARGLWAA